MPRFLIVAATPFEIEGIARFFNVSDSLAEGLMANQTKTVFILVTGVGMVNTAYGLGRCSDHGFDYVINAGICGAFNRSLSLGEVVHVTSDLLSEMGAENDTAFMQYHELNLGGTNVYNYSPGKELAAMAGLKQVKGITVNKVHGSEASIKQADALFKPDVESMEGAAFFRACAHFTGGCLQLRAVSNYVEKRDKSKWNIPLAITNLNDLIIQLIQQANP